MTRDEAREALGLRLSSHPLSNSIELRVKLIQLFVMAEVPIPVELFNTVDTLCDYWLAQQPKNRHHRFHIKRVAYKVKEYSLQNKAKGERQFLAKAYESVNDEFDINNAKDIYEASGSKYKVYKDIVNQGKEEAQDFFDAINAMKSRT